MSASLLQASGVSVRLDGHLIVDDASLTLRHGEVVALVGPNGAGKTTLVRALAGLVPAEGHISLEGRALRHSRRATRPPHRLPAAGPCVSLAGAGRFRRGARALSACGPVLAPSEADRAAVARALVATNIEALAARSVATLSGGERARVALARALASEAPVLLADEPTASLDPRHQLVVMELLRRAAENGAVLAVIHDLLLAARFADRVLVMDRGRLVADGPPADALGAERVAQVFGVTTVSVEAGDARITIPWRPL